MTNEGHGNDLQKIIAQGFDELKHIHGESFDPQKVKLIFNEFRFKILMSY